MKVNSQQRVRPVACYVFHSPSLAQSRYPRACTKILRYGQLEQMVPMLHGIHPLHLFECHNSAIELEPSAHTGTYLVCQAQWRRDESWVTN